MNTEEAKVIRTKQDVEEWFEEWFGEFTPPDVVTNISNHNCYWYNIHTETVVVQCEVVCNNEDEISTYDIRIFNRDNSAMVNFVDDLQFTDNYLLIDITPTTVEIANFGTIMKIAR